MEARMQEERDPVKARQLRQDYRSIRRGWALGGEDFRKWILEAIEKKGGVRSDNFRGAQRREHGYQAAERLLARALETLELEESVLKEMKSTHLEKQAVAWLLKRNTTVTTIWLSQRLNMGHRVNVSRAISQIGKSEERVAKRMRKILLQCTG